MGKVIVIGAGPFTGYGKSRLMIEAMQAAGYEIQYLDIEATPMREEKRPDLVLFDEFVNMDFSKLELRVAALMEPPQPPADRCKGPKGPRGKWGKLK